MVTRKVIGTSYLTWTLAALAVVFLLVQLLLFWPFTVDDAFVSFRYARNLVLGNGLVFNIGERVEGYSNFLWVMLTALLGSLGLDIVLASKILGLLAILGTTYLSIRLLRRYTDDPLYAAGLALLLSSSFGIVFYGITGLETLFLALLILAGNCFFVRDDFNVSWASTLCFYLAALTRPEAILYWPVVVLIDLLKHKSFGRKKLLVWASFLVLYAAFLLWRHYYFGDWLPNTFYAKSPNSPPVISSFPDVYRFILNNGSMLFLLFAVVPCFGRFRRSLTILLWAHTLVGLLFMVYSGGDWMASYRYLVPILPLYAILGVEGIRRAVDALAASSAFQGHLPGRRTVFAGVLVALSIFHLGEGATFWVARDEHPNFIMTSSDLIPAGQWVGDHYPSDYTIVCWRIGALAYYSGLNLIDNGIGLTDKFVARQRYAGTYNAEVYQQYMHRRNPELFMAGAWIGATPRQTMEVGGREYHFVRQFRQGNPQWWFLYERSDIAGEGHATDE